MLPTLALVALDSFCSSEFVILLPQPPKHRQATPAPAAPRFVCVCVCVPAELCAPDIVSLPVCLSDLQALFRLIYPGPQQRAWCWNA